MSVYLEKQKNQITILYSPETLHHILILIIHFVILNLGSNIPFLLCKLRNLFQIFLNGRIWKSQGLDRFVVQVKTKVDTLVKDLLGFRGRVDIQDFIGFYRPVSMIDCRVNDSIANRLGKVMRNLCDNVFGIFFTIQMKLDANVFK